MNFSEKDVEHIAKLARLSLTDIEIQTYRDQLGSILEYVQKLKEVDTSDVPELQHAIEVVNVFRDDVVEECSTEVQTRSLANFPNQKDRLLKVQAVFNGRTE